LPDDLDLSVVSPGWGGNSAAGGREPPYNKLSVRESLASMNARAASNTYEDVADVDNLYATVSTLCTIELLLIIG